MELSEFKSVFTVLHLLGVALGAGGAYMSDFMFFSTIRDEKISSTEMRFLRIGSKAVWAGLILLVLSGIGLFMTNPEYYMHSAKFLIKMTAILVIVLNGFFFHISHLPRMNRHKDTHYPSSDEFVRKQPLLIMSGAISFISWTTALILGSLRSIPVSYSVALAIYIGILVIGVISALFISKRIFKRG